MTKIYKYLSLLLLTLILIPVSASAVTGFSVRTDVDDFSYSIELESGNAVSLGDSNTNDIECLAYNLSGDTLYGVNDAGQGNPPQLVTCNTETGLCTVVFTLDISGEDFVQCGLAFACDGTLYLSQSFDTDARVLRSIDLDTQVVTVIGEQGEGVSGLTSRQGDELCPSGVFGLGVVIDDGDNGLGCMDVETGEFQLIGLFNNPDIEVIGGGIDFDENGVLWGIGDGDRVGDPVIFTINENTGEATVAAETLNGFESLGIAPPFCGEPIVRNIPTLSEWGLIATATVLGFAGVIFVYFRRRATV